VIFFFFFFLIVLKKISISKWKKKSFDNGTFVAFNFILFFIKYITHMKVDDEKNYACSFAYHICSINIMNLTA